LVEGREKVNNMESPRVERIRDNTALLDKKKNNGGGRRRKG